MPDVEGELRARAEADGVEFFFAMFVDMHGQAMREDGARSRRST